MQAFYTCFMKFCLALNSYIFLIHDHQTADQELILVDGLFHCQCLVNVKVRELTGFIGNDSVGRTAGQQVNGISTHCGCVYPVFSCRRTASLNMTKNRGSCLNTCGRFYTFGQSIRIPDTFRIDDNMMFLAFQTV